MKHAAAAALWILTAAAVLSVALVAVRQPFGPGDYVAVWGLKARALERTGEAAALFRIDPTGAASHPEYPPLWSVVLASFSHLFGGRYDDLVVTLLWPLLALAAALLAARATAAPPWGRALAAATVALLPYWKIDLGYAEGLLAVLLLAALGEVPRLGSSRFAPLRLALFLTLAAWTKQEGAVAAAVVAGFLVLSRQVRAGVLVAVSTGLLAILPWRLVVAASIPGRGSRSSPSRASRFPASPRPAALFSTMRSWRRRRGSSEEFSCSASPLPRSIAGARSSPASGSTRRRSSCRSPSPGSTPPGTSSGRGTGWRS